jgi:hypothetical protein
MRFLVIIAALICISSSPAFSKSETSFDEFIKSREVVTTLYFGSNAENLSSGERQRLSRAIDKLRVLQESGRMIRVEGFSSPEGDHENNFRLSFYRARSVAELIESKGLPAEVTLTGYGDLRVSSDNPKQERRVEIASYLKPTGMKKVKVADKKLQTGQKPVHESAQVDLKNQDIDSYRVDQAIRRKIDDKNKGIADKNEASDQELSPGLTQRKREVEDTWLDRGYSQWRKTVDPDFSPKLSKSQETSDRDLKRGYSRIDLEKSPGVTQITPVGAPFIDALMIEQAIMEKIGADLSASSGAVSQLDVNY